MKSFDLSYEDAQDKEDWDWELSGQLATLE